jgi:hypothetical protein
MRKFIKDNIVLVLGFTLPLMLVAFFVLASVIPAMFVANPRYDFLFWDGDQGQLGFEVVNERLNIKYTPNQYAGQATPTLYRYSAATGKTQKVSFKLPDFPKLPVPSSNPPNISANINIPVDPNKPPTPEEARNVAKIVGEIQQNAQAAKIVSIPLAELAQVKLDSSSEAPDGYRFVGGHHYYRGDFVWGFGGSYSAQKVSLIKDGKRVPIHFSNEGPNDYRSPTFIGWVIQ